MKKRNEYALYDTKDNDLLVGIFTATQLAEYFNTSTAVIYCNISRNKLTERRFEIVKLEN